MYYNWYNKKINKVKLNLSTMIRYSRIGNQENYYYFPYTRFFFRTGRPLHKCIPVMHNLPDN